MKVVSFNIRCANDANGHSVAERAPRVKALIDKYDPDVIGFQEVVPRWMEHIPGHYSDTYEIFHKYRDDRVDIEGCPILWKKDKFECLDKGYFWYSDTPDIHSKGWCSWGHYRICMWAKLRDKEKGVDFHFFNTHFGFGDAGQIGSTKLILDHIKNLDAHAVVLTGDFNMTNDYPAYKDMVKGMVDINTVTAQDYRMTCHGYNADRQGKPIDFCFISPHNVKPICYKRIDETFDGKFPSDHYGVYAEVEIQHQITVTSLNLCNKKGNESPEEADNRQGTIRYHQLARTLPELVAMQEATEHTSVRLNELKYHDAAFANGADANPIVWLKELYEKVAEEQVVLPGDGKHTCNILTLRFKTSGKEFCIANTRLEAAFAEESAKVIKEKLAAYEIPVILTGDFGAIMETQAYATLREDMADLRRTVAPRDMTPTYHGFYEDMKQPAIADFVLFKGNGINAGTYGQKENSFWDNIFSDHNVITATFGLEL